jgi:hypothetical protein
MIELFFFFPFGFSNCLKKSSNGEPGGKDGISLDRCSMTVVVEIFTTEGLSFSARSAKLSGALLALAKLIEKSNTNMLMLTKRP